MQKKYLITKTEINTIHHFHDIYVNPSTLHATQTLASGFDAKHLENALID